ncbi:MAG: hypothetical protein M5U26_16835 [Planctomycetota bacterium]|nr:hypothetical protein [Planctomycetota bacterium]
MPATSLIGKTRERLKALAEGVSGGGLTLEASRVRLGYDRMLETGSFFASLLEDGPYLSVGSASLEYASQAEYGPAEVRALLYAGFARGADDDFTAVDDLLEALRVAWNAPASYGEGEAAPIRIGWEAWRTETRTDPGVIVVPLRVQFPDPPAEFRAGRNGARNRLAALARARAPRTRLTHWVRYFVHKSRFEKLAEFSRAWLGG